MRYSELIPGVIPTALQPAVDVQLFPTLLVPVHLLGILDTAAATQLLPDHPELLSSGLIQTKQLLP